MMTEYSYRSLKPMSVIAASYLGPSLAPDGDLPWSEASLPLSCDGLVQEVLGQPMRRTGRFIKMVCSGAMACLKKVPPGFLQGKKTGIFLATGLGNSDEILPFITQVFKHDGGYPSPNQFANSVSNAAAFFLARQSGIKGIILTISDEELSFESALWLAQCYLESGEIDLALVGGCDVFTPTIEEYRERMNVTAENARDLPIGEGSSWFLLGGQAMPGIGGIQTVEIHPGTVNPDDCFPGDAFRNLLDTVISSIGADHRERFLLPGFRVKRAGADRPGRGNWQLYDYLPFCGIHPVAASFGLAHAFKREPSSLLVHYNRCAAGKKAMIVAETR